MGFHSNTTISLSFIEIVLLCRVTLDTWISVLTNPRSITTNSVLFVLDPRLLLLAFIIKKGPLIDYPVLFDKMIIELFVRPHVRRSPVGPLRGS